jgi:hypothetical protein
MAGPKKKLEKEKIDFEEFRLQMLLLSDQEPPEPAPEPPASTDVLPRIRTIKLYYTNKAENSDKVYTLDIVQEPRWKDTYYVDFAYGKRGKTLKTGRKTKIAVSYIEASRIFDAFVADK